MPNSDAATPRSTYRESATSSAVGFYKELFRLADSARETCLPCVVIEQENDNGLIQVVPIINSMIQMSDRMVGVRRGAVYVRPMRFLHGGFMIQAPILVGDTGYLVSCDRDCSDAIRANENIQTDNADHKEVLKDRIKDPNTVDCQKYHYGFFIPCSWVRNESESMKGMFGRDEGIFKDRLVISNYRKAGEDGSAFITIDREGNIMVATENSKAFVNKNGIQIANRTDKTNDSDLSKSRAVKIDGEKCWVYHNGENEDSEDTNGIVASKDGVEVEKILSVKSGELSATMNPKSLKSNAKFRVVRIITGDPERNGDVVSIPTAKITVLCDEPIEDDPLVFNVRDSDR